MRNSPEAGESMISWRNHKKSVGCCWEWGRVAQMGLERSQGPGHAGPDGASWAHCFLRSSRQLVTHGEPSRDMTTLALKNDHSGAVWELDWRRAITDVVEHLGGQRWWAGGSCGKMDGAYKYLKWTKQDSWWLLKESDMSTDINTKDGWRSHSLRWGILEEGRVWVECRGGGSRWRSMCRHRPWVASPWLCSSHSCHLKL